jgi:hypothetical protein
VNLDRLSVDVRGVAPVPRRSNSSKRKPERAWRQHLVERCVATVPSPLPIAVLPTSSFAVEIEFLLLHLGPESADLDNLAKPVLDTLFAPRPNPNAPGEISGAVFDALDSQITELTLRKKVASTQADLGVRIVVSWTA